MDLSICIVNWNTGILLEQCVYSIMEQDSHILFEVLIVENNSSDDSLLHVERRFDQDSRLKVLQQDTNLGFAAANNQALKLSSGRYLLLLNPDTIVKPGFLDEAVSFLDEHPDCGAMGPKLVNADGSLQPSIGGFPEPGDMLWEATRLRKAFPRVRKFSSFKRHDLDYSQLQLVDQPSGACLFVRRAAMKEVGLLDERFFMYYEDLDWCYRIKQVGWLIYYVPWIEVVHLGGQSSAKNLDVRLVENARSRLLYFDKHYRTQLFGRFLVRIALIFESTLRVLRHILYTQRRGSSSVTTAEAIHYYFEIVRLALSRN